MVVNVKQRATSRRAVHGIPLGAAILAGTAVAPRLAVADPCTALADAVLTGGHITTVQSVPAGSYTAGDGVTYTNLPAFCRVAATLTPSSDSNIKIEMWMPSATRIWAPRPPPCWTASR